MKKNTVFYTVLGILILLVFWEIVSFFAGSEILVPGPRPVLKKFVGIASTERFLLSLSWSFYRVILAMLISVPLSLCLGALTALDKRAGALFKPLFQVISATPVMSIILIAFLWFGQERTPVFTAFLVIFPVMTANTIEGINAIDPKLKELLKIYNLSLKERFLSLYIPGILPFVLGGLRSGLSLCWKVVVAAEVLVQPRFSLGAGMQSAKAQLETAELFAWTAGTIIAAAITQSFLSLAIRRIKKRR